MTTWIWKDHPISLRIAVIVMSILFLLLTLGQLHSWSVSYGSWLEPLLAFLFAVSSYGMLRMASWARWVTVVFLWLLVVLLIVGIFNPYMASDWSAGTPPSVATLLAYIIPAEAAIILVLHILTSFWVVRLAALPLHLIDSDSRSTDPSLLESTVSKVR